MMGNIHPAALEGVTVNSLPPDKYDITTYLVPVCRAILECLPLCLCNLSGPRFEDGVERLVR